MVRTYPAECTVADAARRRARAEDASAATRSAGGYYEWEGVRYVPVVGRQHVRGADADARARRATLAPREPRRERPWPTPRCSAATRSRTLGYPVWGLSPSAVPRRRRLPRVRRAASSASRGYGAGAVTPHAAALALAVDAGRRRSPNLRALAERYDALRRLRLLRRRRPAHRRGRAQPTSRSTRR